jgi:hypothetical protein
MRNRFTLRLFGVAAMLTAFVADQACYGQARKETRPEREDPGLQQIAADYYAKKYRVSAGEAQRRLAIQDRAAGIDDDLTKTLGDQYAGIWYDHADRGRLKIGMTRRAMARVSEVSSVLKRYGVASLADLKPVRFTLADLERKQDDVRNSIMDMVSRGDAVTGYDTKFNRVVVTALVKLPPEEQVRVKNLTRREGVIVRRVDVPTLRGTFDSCNVTYCNPPFRGGREIDGPAVICTAAFMARQHDTGDLLAMTAGHCIFFGGNPTGSWKATDEANNSLAIGPSYGYVFSGSVGMDAGVVSIAPANFWATPPPMPALVVKPSSITTYDPEYAIYHDSWSSLGQILCRTGRTTGTHCAEVSGLGKDFVGVFSANGPGYLIRQMGELDMCLAQGGDSGAPVYKMHRAYGIFSASISAKPWHCFESYQGIRGAEGALNVDILLAP